MGKKAEKKRQARANRADSKTFLVFDEQSRREWLTGFSKRKKERQQKAKDDLVKLLKEEKIRQKDEHRIAMKKNEAKYLERIKDVEEIVKEKTSSYTCGGKTVEITEYNLTAGEEMIGPNNDVENEEENLELAEGEQSEQSESEIPTLSRKLPKKMSRTAVKIEKRLYKLNHKQKKRKVVDDQESNSKGRGRKGVGGVQKKRPQKRH